MFHSIPLSGVGWNQKQDSHPCVRGGGRMDGFAVGVLKQETWM